jgi:perosamine synthetase
MYKDQIPLSVPEISGNEWRYVKECLDTGWISTVGRFVTELENKIAAYTDGGQAVACASGTAALHTALLVAGVQPGDEVIVPTVTFIAPINAVRYVGAEPVFMDCDDYLNIDPDKTNDFITKACEYKKGRLINKRSGKRVRAMIPVHVFGHPADLDALLPAADKYKLTVIEDATESLGSHYKKSGRKTGVVGQLGCFSFNGNKIITAGGGGMLVTGDERLAARARYLTTQAKDDNIKYVHNEIGYNYRLNNVQAAIGLSQLERLDEFVGIKRANFGLYKKLLAGVAGLSFIEEPSYAFSNYWFYSLVVDQRKYGRSAEALRLILERAGIHARPLWQLNHRQKPYRGYQAYRIEKAGRYAGQILNLPCSVGLKKPELKRIAEVIRKNAVS